MVDLSWLFGGENILDHCAVPNPSAAEGRIGTARQLREMEFRLNRMALLNQALWELLRDKLNITEAEFEARVKEIDLRDGVGDGQMSDLQGPLQCPQCGRISNSRHWKCLYCGLEFERPTMA